MSTFADGHCGFPAGGPSALKCPQDGLQFLFGKHPDIEAGPDCNRKPYFPVGKIGRAHV
jgi:hypothetical protein